MYRTPTNVLLIEDSELYARLIGQWLEQTWEHPLQLTRATCLATALKQLAKTAFELIILDLHLPDSDGLDSYHRLVREAGATPVVIVTGAGEKALAVDAVRAGAQDYLVKGEVAGPGLVRALRLAIERAALQRDKVPAEASNGKLEQQQLSTLSPREQQVLHQLIAGKSVKQIAEAFGTKYYTVKNQRASIMRKLQARSVVELTRMALLADQNTENT